MSLFKILVLLSLCYLSGTGVAVLIQDFAWYMSGR